MKQQTAISVEERCEVNLYKEYVKSYFDQQLQKKKRERTKQLPLKQLR